MVLANDDWVPPTENIDIWATERLVFRSADDPAVEGFHRTLWTDSFQLAFGDSALTKPKSKKELEKETEGFSSGLITVVICLKPSDYDKPVMERYDPKDKFKEKEQLIPIGITGLFAYQPHIRKSMFGIQIVQGYRNKGYGSEAMKWIIDYGFLYANLHKISLQSHEHNARSISVYKRIGFTLEGTERHGAFWNGRYADILSFGILEDEWRALREEKAKAKLGAA